MVSWWWYRATYNSQLTQDSKAGSNGPLNMRTHGEVAVEMNADVLTLLAGVMWSVLILISADGIRHMVYRRDVTLPRGQDTL